MSLDTHPLVIAARNGLPGTRILTAQGVIHDPAPISINDLYTTFRGKRVLTSAGRSYRDALASTVARSTTEWKKGIEAVYEKRGEAFLVVGIYFKDLKNHSWKAGARTPSGSLQEPRKKQDSANYLKLVEDAVVRGSGIDDCNNTAHLLLKLEDEKKPRTEFIYMVTLR
jgi:hypothetical protein